MTVNEKMGLVINLAEKALAKNELPIACIIFHGDTIVAQSHTSESEEKMQMELFTNLEPCMMCFGAAISSFIGRIYYSLAAPSDGAAKWAAETWSKYHTESVFHPPVVMSGILESESRALFKRYIDIHKESPMTEWAKTIIGQGI